VILQLEILIQYCWYQEVAGFDFRAYYHFHVTTLGKLLTHIRTHTHTLLQGTLDYIFRVICIRDYYFFFAYNI